MRFPDRLLAVAALAVVSIGCNTAAKINAPKIYFFQAQILGAVPVVKNGDAYERVCRTGDVQGGRLEGFAIDVELLSTERKEQDESNIDKDRSIQVDDYINRHYVLESDLNREAVTLSLDCVKRAGETLARECDAATDIQAPAAEIVDIQHVPFALRRDTWGGGSGDGVGVIVLLDQSGSVGGFVQPDSALGHYEMPYDDANMLITEYQKTQDPLILEKLASDKRNYRVPALHQFISRLNANDKLLVVSYNEDHKNLVVCEGGSELPEDPSMADCFVTRRDWVLKGLDASAGNESGRTPLWEALYGAYEFLESESGVAAKHIVVLGDGPDTCHPTSEHFRGGTPCGDRAFEEVVAQVEGGANDIHLHFVQYQTVGYRARDPRQMELSCLTDGSYVFINRTDLANQEFESSLLKALDRVRYSFLGKWRLFVDSSVVALSRPWPEGTPPGGLYSVFGNLKLLAEKNPFMSEDSIYTFHVGNQSSKSGIQQTPNWDNSLIFRKDCTANSDCFGSDDAQCVHYCGWESQICYEGGVSSPFGETCTMGDGSTGGCCNGACQAAGTPCE
jgi:hypothetical protein